MSRARQQLRGLACALVCAAAVIATVGPAQATTVPASAARQFYSPQASGGALYWFERGGHNIRVPRRFGVPIDGPGFGTTPTPAGSFFVSDPWLPGAIYSRPLPGGQVKKVYKAPRGKRINGFKARGGRVVIGVEQGNEFDDRPVPTQINELKPNAGGGWDVVTLISRGDVVAGGDCGSSVRLFNVDADGNVVVVVSAREGLNGACELLRTRTSLVELAPNGSQRTLTEEVSGWGGEDASFDLPTIRSGAGDWYLSAEGDYYYETGDVEMKNAETGESFRFPDINRQFFNAEVSATGAALVTNPYSTIDHTLLFPDPRKLDRAVHLGRRGSITWFHMCDDKIVEFARKRATKRRRGGHRWNVYTRSVNGDSAQALNVHLARGTRFETCNKDFAFLHQRLRKGRARQFAVALTPVAPTGATGPTP